MLAAIGFSAAASPVDAESAAAVARSFIAQRVANAGHVTATVVYTHMKPQSSSPAMYAVNVTYGNNGKGFVIVSADDVAYPVLGYSVAAYWPTTGAKGTGAAVPLCSQITEYLNGISSQIEQASSSSYRHPSSSVAEWQQLLSTNVTPLTTPPDSVGPLLVTQWSQSPYYNEYCPEDANNPGNKAVTGCVATAMAQIIRYWQHPVHGRGTHTYEDNGSGNFGVQSADFANATYDYANMPFTLNASSTPAQVNAVAHLIYHCGVACDMTYGIYGSSSYDIVARVGLINYFHYSPDISYVEKSNVSATQWDSILHHHLAAGEPLMFCGDDPNAGGHAFVCDGYKSDGYYHFNFGWDGYGDGWYRTDAVNPSYQFNSGQSVLAGIVPDNNGNVILANRRGTSTFTVGNQPLEFYNTRGHDVYRANCYTNDCSNNVLFTSSDATKQLNIEMIDADCQNLNVYDGEGGTLLTGISSVITASGCNVTTLGPSQVSSTGNELYLVHQGDFRCVGYKVRISQSSASATAYIISATSNNASMGSVTGGGTYDAGATVTLTATSNCGCRFVRWTSNGTQVSTENPYSFAASQNISLTAEFETDVVLTCSSGQSLKYVLDCNNNTATIVGHNGCNGALVLPSEIVYNNQNYVVNRVADTAFYNSGITSLVIPEPINYIGSLAFGACENLQQVTFNAVNCTLAGSTAEVSPFGDNSHITTVVIGPGVTTIPAWLFGHHSGITGNLVIPEGVTRIEKDAFSYAEITSVTLPQSLQYIGWGAFYGCYNLTSVTFPNAVDTIMNYSFAYDYALRKVSFGSSVAFIGAYAFSSCGNMDTIWSYNPVPPSAANALYGVAGDAVIVVPCGSVPAYQAAGEWSNFTNIREVAGCAFTVTAVANDASMGTVTGGGEYADGTTVTLTATPVWGCRFVRWKNAAGDTVSLDATFSITVTQDTALTAEFSDRIPIVAPSGQTLYYRIYNTYAELVPPGAPGPGVIYNNNYIEGDLVIPESIIYDGVELNVTAIRKVTNGWGSSTGCFEGCRTLTSVVIPNTVTYMDAWAFNDCTNLTSVVLSNSLSSIAACAFMSCLSLRNITIPSSVHAIYDRAFYYSGLRSIIIPSSVNYFDDLTFKYCYSLDSVFIFNEIPPSISSNTFTVGSSNRKYYVPCGTTSAYQNSWGTDYVFSEDWEPYTVETLVNDVSMGSATSSICVYMATLTATPNSGYTFVRWSDGNTDNPRQITVTGDINLTAVFAPMGNMTEQFNIRTCTGHTLRFEVSNVTHTATVIGYVGQCAGTLVVPAWFSVDGVRYTVTAVGPRAFENCRGLESVTLPVTITLVDDEAFKGCSGLISVDIK